MDGERSRRARMRKAVRGADNKQQRRKQGRNESRRMTDGPTKADDDDVMTQMIHDPGLQA